MAVNGLATVTSRHDSPVCIMHVLYFPFDDMPVMMVLAMLHIIMVRVELRTCLRACLARA